MIFELKNLLSQKAGEVFDWLNNEIEKNKINLPIYSSIDVRISDKKIAHVDSNIFPAGFNLLDQTSISKASDEMYNFILNKNNKIKKIALIAEDYSKNLKYLQNIDTLKYILESKNFEVDIVYLNLPQKNILQKNKENKVICSNGFDPDFIILNNDLILESPNILQDLDLQISPSVKLGWHSRTKHQHIEKYKEIANKFSNYFSIDPWLIEAYYERCCSVDISKGIGIDALIEQSSKLIERIKIKYKEYNIKNEPSVFIKAESSTHGLGILTIRNPEELKNLNKKERKKMLFTKYKTKIDNVIIQEAIPSIQQIDSFVAESTCYIVNGNMIGGFRRFHKNKGDKDNLNAVGAEFVSSLEEKYIRILQIICKLTSIANAKELS